MKGRRKKKTPKTSKSDQMENNIQKINSKEEQALMMMRTLGLFAGLASKVLLEKSGCVVDYKINGENITDIEKLHAIDISDRLKLAVKEERFEDAMNLKKILDELNNEQKQIEE